MGDRVTARLRDGRLVRLALPFRAAHPLPSLALDVLALALEPPTWHALACRQLCSPGQPRHMHSQLKPRLGVALLLRVHMLRSPVQGTQSLLPDGSHDYEGC